MNSSSRKKEWTDVSHPSPLPPTPIKTAPRIVRTYISPSFRYSRHPSYCFARKDLRRTRGSRNVFLLKPSLNYGLVRFRTHCGRASFLGNDAPVTTTSTIVTSSIELPFEPFVLLKSSLCYIRLDFYFFASIRKISP